MLNSIQHLQICETLKQVQGDVIVIGDCYATLAMTLMNQIASHAGVRIAMTGTSIHRQCFPDLIFRDAAF